jgi:flagellar hook-associated protein 2
MSSFRSLGVGSGLDLETLVANLLRAERQPREAQITRSRRLAQTRLSAFGTLKSAVSGLSTAVNALKDFRLGLTAASSDPSRVGVRAGDGASAGQFVVGVSRLATAQSLASATFADPDATLGSGQLTLSVGGESVVLGLDGTNSSLRGVRDAIEQAGLGVQAVVVKDGEQYRLLLTSGSTGLDGAMTLTAGAGLDTRLGSGAMTETVAAQDAAFSVNGLSLTSSSNTVDDVVPGVTLTLAGVTEEASPVAVTVSTDRQDLRTRLESLVRAYNTLVDAMAAAGRADPEGVNSGPLVGDATLRAIQSRVGGVFSARQLNVPGGGPSSLLELGLSSDVSGRASLDASRLADQLESDPAAVEQLVSAFAAKFSAALDGFGAAGGILDARRDNLSAELRRLDAQTEALDQRMEQVERRLRAQFSALDTLLAQFQNTSSYLTQQLESLSNLTSDSRR